MEKQNRRLRQVTTDVLALAHELRKGTIDRIMAMSDLELGCTGADESSSYTYEPSVDSAMMATVIWSIDISPST